MLPATSGRKAHAVGEGESIWWREEGLWILEGEIVHFGDFGRATATANVILFVFGVLVLENSFLGGTRHSVMFGFSDAPLRKHST
jgi:hypothetical protein